MSGCSRTNPIEWTGVNVKKEPGTPCQVAEITTSMSPVVKVEVTSPTQKNGSDTTNLGGSIVNGKPQFKLQQYYHFKNKYNFLSFAVVPELLGI